MPDDKQPKIADDNTACVRNFDVTELTAPA
jgi:hypothetical protein